MLATAALIGCAEPGAPGAASAESGGTGIETDQVQPEHELTAQARIEALLGDGDADGAATLAVEVADELAESREATDAIAERFEALFDLDTAAVVRRARYRLTARTDDEVEQLQALIDAEYAIGEFADRFEAHVRRWDLEEHRSPQGLAILCETAIAYGAAEHVEECFRLVGRQLGDWRHEGLAPELVSALQTFSLPAMRPLWTAIDARYVVPIYEVYMDSSDGAAMGRLSSVFADSLAGQILTGHHATAELWAAQPATITLAASDTGCTWSLDGEPVELGVAVSIATGSHAVRCEPSGVTRLLIATVETTTVDVTTLPQVHSRAPSAELR